LTYEIIVIDNNSNDGSVDIIQNKFSDVYVISHNDNAGTSIAYNIGINAAKGKYILIQNSDTEYFENSTTVLHSAVSSSL
jgi:glycosyltransferase involved in cell wall biosynthesis